MIYPSIDVILTKVDSKYELVHIVARRSKQMTETQFFQLKESEYKQKKNIGRALEEIAADMIEVIEIDNN